LTGLTVDVDIASDTDLFGKTVSDLQSDIVIGSDEITGTLNYIDDYSSAFSGELSSGNFIAIHASVPDVEDVTITVKVTNPVTLDDDGIAVLRIADKSSQTITVVASKEGYTSVQKVFGLSGLTCETED
jgi:hypothetical protein